MENSRRTAGACPVRARHVTLVGLAFLVSAQLAGPTSAEGQTTAGLVDEPSGAVHGGLEDGTRAGDASFSRIRSRLLSRGSARQVPHPRLRSTESGVKRFFVQGGLYGWGEGAGFVFGGGGTVSPAGGIRILGDGHVIGEPGYGSAFYGSGTLAYQIGSDGGENALLGIGVGGVSEDYYSKAGPQLVLGLGVKAGFAQIRVVSFNQYHKLVLLLGGVKF